MSETNTAQSDHQEGASGLPSDATGSVSVRSEIGSYLYPLYLFFLAWLLLPVYAEFLSTVLTIPGTDTDRLLRIVGILAGPLAWWSGNRGGPLLLSEPVVLFDVASGKSRHRVMFAVVRQALLAGAVVGLCATFGSALGSGSDLGFGISTLRTLTGVAVGVAPVALAVLWTTDSGNLRRDRATAVVGSVAMAVVMLAMGSTWNRTFIIFGLAALYLLIGVIRSIDIPLAVLWHRSSAMNDLLVSTTFLDAPGAIKALRSVRDGTKVRRIHQPGRRLMPLAVWHTIRSIAGSPTPVFVRLGFTPIVLAVLTSYLDSTNTRLLAAGAVLFVATTDSTAPLGAVVEQPLSSRSYRFGTRILLTTHVVIAMVITTALAGAGWLLATIGGSPTELRSLLAVALVAAAAGALQTRLSSPNLNKLINKLGAQVLSSVMAGMATLPFVVLIVSTISIARLDSGIGIGLEPALIIGLVASAVVGTVRPLEA